MIGGSILAKFNWSAITREDVIKAIERFLYENPEYPEPRSTFLVFAGKKLPAKHIRGMAYKEHFNLPISKSDYSGGMETVRFFERLGFEMDYRGNINKDVVETNKKQISNKNLEIKNKLEIESTVKKETTESVEELVLEKTQSKEGTKEKITIPSKKVIEQKNALQLLLNRIYSGDIVCEKTYPWLKTPEKIDGVYKKLYEDLSAYRGDKSFAKKNVSLRCDFVCESQKIIIEYDERQHFSEARRISLEAYKEVDVLFDRDLWIKACQDICAKDNSPVNRDEVRAYYDSARDIACSEHGYKLIRIMHGQIDFEADNAEEKLRDYINLSLVKLEHDNKEETQKVEEFQNIEKKNIKVAMYLQTNELKNKKAFNIILPVMKEADVDLIVFPEYCYVPFVNEMICRDIALVEDQNEIFSMCLALSKEIGKAIIVSSHDKYDTIFSIFANANPDEGETDINLYIKHTMCGSSCLDFQQYPELAADIFDPFLFKGNLIGMTICYDCNHALFSRMYGMYGIDLIINSTGGNVIYDKWFKYNKVRAIENECYTLVTMGGDGLEPNSNNYVFGFNKNGGQLEPTNISGESSKHNVSGGLYVYELGNDKGLPEVDTSNQTETINKNWNFSYPVGGTEIFLKEAERISDNIFRKKIESYNVFFILVDGMEILKPEIIQKLLYSKLVKKYSNRKYIIVNKHKLIDKKFFDEKLSIILKVRAMENFCAVILESENIKKCYQCGKNRTAQIVKETDGTWGVDLERTTGPEAIWKNKQGMRASWRKNYEWLVENAETIYDNIELR